MLSADISDSMPPLALQLIAISITLVIPGLAIVSPAAVPPNDAYSSAVKAICGAVAIAGSMCLARVIRLTLLQSGGTVAFRGAYVAAAALGGLGLAVSLSAFQPVSIGSAMAAYGVISVASGMLWVRSYGRVA